MKGIRREDWSIGCRKEESESIVLAEQKKGGEREIIFLKIGQGDERASLLSAEKIEESQRNEIGSKRIRETCETCEREVVGEQGPNSMDAERVPFRRPYYLLGFGLRIKTQH